MNHSSDNPSRVFKVSRQNNLRMSNSLKGHASNDEDNKRFESQYVKMNYSYKEIGEHISKFTHWYLKKYSPDELVDMIKDDTWGSASAQARNTFEVYGNDLPYLWERFREMREMDENDGDYDDIIIDSKNQFKQRVKSFEEITLEDLRDRGASIPDLIDYIRAEPGFNPENKPIRADVASDLRKKLFLSKSKRIESTGRSAAIAVGALVLVGVASIAASGPLAAPFAAWIPKAWSLATGIIKTAAGGGLMIMAWRGWNQINSTKNSKPQINIGPEKDFSDLPNTIGNMNYKALDEEYESIPVADLHLIKHLSPAELRVFFAGSDNARLHILRSSPPPAWSKIQSRMVPVLQKESGIIKKTSLLLWTMISAPWHREKDNARVPDLKERMKNWREFSRVNQKFPTSATIKDHKDVNGVGEISISKIGKNTI